MNADQVRALVAAKFPGILESPLALAMHGASAMAQLESSDADEVVRVAELRATGREHAERCMAACGGWTVETLSVQVECATDGGLEEDECDEIARAVLAAAGGRR